MPSGFRARLFITIDPRFNRMDVRAGYESTCIMNQGVIHFHCHSSDLARCNGGLAVSFIVLSMGIYLTENRTLGDSETAVTDRRWNPCWTRPSARPFFF